MTSPSPARPSGARPPTKLENRTLAPDEWVYLDTSAVFSLTSLAIAKNKPEVLPTSNRDQFLGKRVESFLHAIKRQTPAARTTVLVLEEIASMVRSRLRKLVCPDLSKWKPYLAGNPTADDRPLKVALKVLEYAVNSLANCAVMLDHPVEAAPALSASLARDLRRAHRGLLQKYPSIDSMDALHIAFGKSMGGDLFVSFDDGWKSVVEIEVLY